MRFSANEIKALALYYGSYRKAAAKTGVGTASLTDAGNGDIKGTHYTLSDKNYQKINRHINRLGPKAKKQLRDWNKLLESNNEHPNANKAFMNGKQWEREAGLKTFLQYGNRMDGKTLWNKILTKFYDKHNWQKGRWKR